jgi:hypothetical protein
MAKNKPPSASDAAEQADALARAISEQLPGWKLAQKQSIANDDGSRDIRAYTRGPDLKELREKFFGSDHERDVVDAADEFKESDRVSVLVEPADGGPVKVADIVKGKVKLVQG